MNINKLRNLIKEVLREEDDKTTTSNTENDPKINSKEEPEDIEKDDHDEYKPTINDFELKFVLSPNSKLSGGKKDSLNDLLKKLNYEFKKQGLQAIHAEIEKSGKILTSMDKDDLSGTKKIDKKFDTRDYYNKPNNDIAAKKNINVGRKEKIRPPIHSGIGYDPKDWEAAGQQDSEEALKRAKLKKAKIAAGTYDPEDQSLWSDKDWDEELSGERTASGKNQSYKVGKFKKPDAKLSLGTIK